LEVFGADPSSIIYKKSAGALAVFTAASSFSFHVHRALLPARHAIPV